VNFIQKRLAILQGIGYGACCRKLWLFRGWTKHVTPLEQARNRGFFVRAGGLGNRREKWDPPRVLDRRVIEPETPMPTDGEVLCRERLGGLLKSYYREAA
jgi:hypothetical protein